MESTTIGNLPEYLHYMDLSQDVAATLDNIGCEEDYGMVFVGAKDGELIEVWAAYGTVPYLPRTAYQIVAPDTPVTKGCECCQE